MDLETFWANHVLELSEEQAVFTNSVAFPPGIKDYLGFEDVRLGIGPRPNPPREWLDVSEDDFDIDPAEVPDEIVIPPGAPLVPMAYSLEWGELRVWNEKVEDWVRG